MSVVTGAVVDVESDFHLADAPFAFSFGRSYDSTYRLESSEVGSGFRHTFDVDLRVDVDGFSFFDPHLRGVGFPFLLRDGDSADRSGYTLRRLTDRRYRVETKKGFVFELELARAPHARSSIVAFGKVDGPTLHARSDASGRIVGLDLDPHRSLAFDYVGASLVSVRLLTSAEKPRVLCRYVYDTTGRLREAYDPYGHAVRYAYDAQLRLCTKAERTGYRFHFAYDAHDRCTRTYGDDGMLDERLEYLPLERTTIVTRADGAKRSYFYNENGVIVLFLDAEGGKTSYELDALGRPRFELDGADNRTEILYDARHNAIAKRDPLGHVRRFPADPTPHPLSHREPETPLAWQHGYEAPLPVAPLSTTDFYAASMPRWTMAAVSLAPWVPVLPVAKRDIHGLLLSEQSFDGKTRRFGYDASGNLRKETDFEGRVTEYIRDAWNQLAEVKDAAGARAFYRHGKNDKLTGFTDAGGTATEFVYDAKDRLAEVHRHGRLRERYVYDHADNLTERIDAQGRTLARLTIAPGNLIAGRRFLDGTEEKFTYDERGRMRTANNPHAKCTFAHGHLGHRTLDARLEEREGEEVAVGVAHRFDLGRLARTTVLDRFEIRYQKVDAKTRLVQDPTGRTHRIRTHFGGVVEREFASGTIEYAQHDLFGRCIAKAAESQGRTPETTRLRFTYSADGDLVAREAPGTSPTPGTTRYEHDALHRLARVIHPDGTTDEYRYDAAGNLLEAPGLVASVANGNKLHGANGDAFVYDERDHVCERRGRGGTITYRYNGRDQLSALDAPGLVYRAEHDALGRRVSKTAAGRTTRFYWDGDRLAAEVDADGALRVYVYPDEGALVPMLFVDYARVDADPASGKVYEVFTDHLGTPERIRDADGNLVWQARIAPYGRAEVLVGAGFHQPFRFPGHYYDAETGLHENRFRSYAPELGRYLQTDPIGLSGGTNLYAYTWNPLVDVDLRGLVCADDVVDCPHKPVTPDAEAPLDPNGRHGMPPHGQTIPERAATLPPRASIPDYARQAPANYFYDPETGSYPRRAGAGRDRRTDYPSGFRQSTLDAMAAQHTREGQALGDTPRHPNGDPIDHSQLTWIDPDDPTQDLTPTADNPLTLDHVVSVVEMDNYGASFGDHDYPPGSNASRDVRNDFFNNPDNLRPMLRSQNSSRAGGLDYDGRPMRYIQDTGPDYSHR